MRLKACRSRRRPQSALGVVVGPTGGKLRYDLIRIFSRIDISVFSFHPGTSAVRSPSHQLFRWYFEAKTTGSPHFGKFDPAPVAAIGVKGASMSEASGFQLSGSAPELYEHYIVPALSTGNAEELVTLAALKPGERILDVACGTGVLSRHASEAVGPTGEVTGLDVNEGMLSMARTISSPGGSSISYREGSALAIPFPEATFDVVLCQWGLEFFPDRSQGLHEMGRVLTPEGRLGLRVWCAMEQQAFHMAAFAALDRHLWGGQDFPSRAGFADPFSLWDAEELRTLVLNAGFRDIDMRVSTVPIRLASDNAAMLGYLSALPIGVEIAKMEEAARTEMLHEVMTTLNPFVKGEEFVIPTAGHVVLARR